MQRPNEELVWYYEHSASELGFSSSSIDGIYIQSDPQPPSRRQLAAASRQARIKASLGELSPRLRSILESCYDQAASSTPLRHEHGLAASLVARAISEARSGNWTKEQLNKSIATCHVMVVTAHKAFSMVHRPERRPSTRRRARVERWLTDDGVIP